jgi:hypothetical protein
LSCHAGLGDEERRLGTSSRGVCSERWRRTSTLRLYSRRGRPLPSHTAYYRPHESLLTHLPPTGRRVLRLHLSLYLSSSLAHTPAVLSQYLSQDSLDALLETKELGAGGSVGKAWGLENVMRWREVVSIILCVQFDLLLTWDWSAQRAQNGEPSGLFKSRGAAVESIVGAVYFQHVRPYFLLILAVVLTRTTTRRASQQHQNYSPTSSSRRSPSLDPSQTHWTRSDETLASRSMIAVHPSRNRGCKATSEDAILKPHRTFDGVRAYSDVQLVQYSSSCSLYCVAVDENLNSIR